VHLYAGDVIYVEKKETKPKEENPIHAEDRKFVTQLQWLLSDGSHSDITFVVGSEMKEFRAHKGILAARSDYFKAMFQEGRTVESDKDRIIISQHDPVTFKRMLDYLYSNQVDIEGAPKSEYRDLLILADKYQIEGLRKKCEELSVITSDNVAELLQVSVYHNATELKRKCIAFAQENKSELPSDFQELAGPVGWALFCADEPDTKKRRLSKSTEGIHHVPGSNQC
jgi:hypothetical protein